MNQPTSDEELRLDKVDTYANMVDALRAFAKRLAKQSLEMDEQVKNYNMLASQKEEIVASTIESFVYAVIKTREQMYKARDAAIRLETMQEMAYSVNTVISDYQALGYQADVIGIINGYVSDHTPTDQKEKEY